MADSRVARPGTVKEPPGFTSRTGWIVWICYVDESGNTGLRLDDPDQPYHVIAAVIVPEDQVRNLHSRYYELIADHWPGQPTGSEEFHGANLFSGSDEWLGVSPPDRIAAYRAMLGLITEMDAWVAHATIDKPRLKSRYAYPDSPHLLATTFLAQKLDAWVFHSNDATRQRAILVADSTEEHERFVMDRVREMQQSGDPFFGRQLSHIVESVFFVRSETSPGVQLADLVAYALNRRLKGRSKAALGQGDVALDTLYDEFVSPRCVTWREPWP